MTIYKIYISIIWVYISQKSTKRNDVMQTFTLPSSGTESFIRGSKELAQTQLIANDLQTKLKNGNFWGPDELEAILLKSLDKLSELKKNS